MGPGEREKGEGTGSVLCRGSRSILPPYTGARSWLTGPIKQLGCPLPSKQPRFHPGFQPPPLPSPLQTSRLPSVLYCLISELSGTSTHCSVTRLHTHIQGHQSGHCSALPRLGRSVTPGMTGCWQTLEFSPSSRSHSFPRLSPPPFASSFCLPLAGSSSLGFCHQLLAPHAAASHPSSGHWKSQTNLRPRLLPYAPDQSSSW